MGGRGGGGTNISMPTCCNANAIIGINNLFQCLFPWSQVPKFMQQQLLLNTEKASDRGGGTSTSTTCWSAAAIIKGHINGLCPYPCTCQITKTTSWGCRFWFCFLSWTTTRWWSSSSDRDVLWSCCCSAIANSDAGWSHIFIIIAKHAWIAFINYNIKVVALPHWHWHQHWQQIRNFLQMLLLLPLLLALNKK